MCIRATFVAYVGLRVNLLPPSNLQQMFMYTSAQFAVKFPVKNYVIIHNILHVHTQYILCAINKNVQLYCCTYWQTGICLRLISQQYSEYHISFADRMTQLSLDCYQLECQLVHHYLLPPMLFATRTRVQLRRHLQFYLHY